MFNNGTVSKNSSYDDICNKQFVNARVALLTWGGLKVNIETNTMIEQDIYPAQGDWSQIPWDWEILKSFLINHNILVTWIQCDSGGFEESGALFKVLQFNVAKQNVHFVNPIGLISEDFQFNRSILFHLDLVK